MSTKSFKELKNLSKDELLTKIRQTEAELFKNRMSRVTGQLANVSLLWKQRKDVARMKTLLSAQSKTAAAPAKSSRGK